MKKNQIYLILILVLLVTSIISWVNPGLHKKVEFENAETKVNNQNINTMPQKEKIIWNKWRSDIVNRIMQTTQISITEEPLGTINVVEFTVDKNRNVSNIKISAEPQEYTKMAQTHFFESINKLNGDSILDFPKDSDRKIMTFKNYFETGKTTKYTKPQDFSDTETLNK